MPYNYNLYHLDLYFNIIEQWSVIEPFINYKSFVDRAKIKTVYPSFIYYEQKTAIFIQLQRIFL